MIHSHTFELPSLLLDATRTIHSPNYPPSDDAILLLGIDGFVNVNIRIYVLFFSSVALAE